MDVLGKHISFASLYLLYLPFIKCFSSKLFIPFLGLWCLLNAFLCIACSNSWRNTTWASSLFAHARTVPVWGSLMKGYHVGCLWCAWLGEETCVVGMKGERWCVKARLICLWLALIKVTPRRAVNTHRDSLIIISCLNASVVSPEKFIGLLLYIWFVLFCFFAFQTHIRRYLCFSNRRTEPYTIL